MICVPLQKQITFMCQKALRKKPVFLIRLFPKPSEGHPPLLSLCLPNVSIFLHIAQRCRRHPVALLEFPVKITGIRIPHFLRNVIDLHIRIQDQILCNLIFRVAQILGKRAPHLFLENLPQIGRVHMVFVRQRFQIHVLFVIFPDLLHDLCYPQLVGTIQLSGGRRHVKKYIWSF